MGIESYEEEDLSGFPLWLLPLALTPLLLRKPPPATSLVVEPVPATPPVLAPVPGQPSLFMESERAPVSAPPIAPVPPPKTIAVAKAQKKVTIDTAKLIKEHEASVKKRLATEAKKLAKAGVSQKTIEREVQAVLKKLPSAQLSKAAAELKKTGKVSTTTKKAIQDASKAYQNAHPELKQAVNKAAKPLRDAQKAIPQDLKREIDAFTKDVPGPLKNAANALQNGLRNGKLDAGALTALGTQEGKKQLEKYGQQYGGAALSKAAGSIGLNIPGGLPVAEAASAISTFAKDPSIEGAGQAAYSGGKAWAEAAIQSNIGVPISLPQKISLKEFGKTFDSLVPDNAREALELSLSIGTQAAASAVSSLLAGTAIGSVIPGLGTLVGIAAAIGVNALRNALKEEPIGAQRKCNSDFISTRIKSPVGGYIYKNPKCPEPPKDMSALEIIPWAATAAGPIRANIAKQQAKKECGIGAIMSCETYLSILMRKAEDLSKSTVGTLGLPQVERLIGLYEKAPATFDFFDRYDYSSRGVTQGSLKIVKEQNQEVVRMLAALKKRRDVLKVMLRAAETALSRIPVSMSSSVSLVDNAIRPVQDELKNALLQYQFSNKSKAAEQWLSTVLGLLQKAADKRSAILKTSQKYYDKKYGAAIARGEDPFKNVAVT